MKSAALNLLLLTVSLDVTVDARADLLKGTGDFGPDFMNYWRKSSGFDEAYKIGEDSDGNPISYKQ